MRGPRRFAGRIPDDEEQLSFDLDALPLAPTRATPVRVVEPVVEPVVESTIEPTIETVSESVAPEAVPGDLASSAADRPGGLSAVRIAELLDRPAPTPEQVAVIEAPPEPLLVVAGAGSGKTETMAARVVWLIANGHVAPEQVLGLTFTRKAAAELADRVRLRLRALRRFLPGGPGGPGGHGGVPGTPGEPLLDGVRPVAVTTYHAYAASLLADHGLRLGLDSGVRLIGEAGAWQLADQLVERWDGDMSAVDAARATVVDAVLALAGECAEHLVEVAQADAVIGQVLDRVVALPATTEEVAPGRPMAPVRTVLGKLAARRQVLPLVEAYLRRKRELGVLDFGDQMALAARLALTAQDVGTAARHQFRVVLLDEYQDTSHAQLTLLRALFGDGHPVTAVGDPHQSIYGWRGASAGNLQRFPADFPCVDADPASGRPVERPAEVVQLATSWRNDHAVLAAANRVAQPLRGGTPWAPHAPRVDVPALRARDGAGAGQVRLQWHATVEDEADAVAAFAETAWRAGDSVAVLCRTRAQFPLVEAALRVRGLPVEVVGLGGLLHVPEVADLRAALEVVHDAARGDALMRLLTGAAWRIGPADLDALGAWARVLHRDLAGHRRDASPTTVADHAEELSLAVALDELPPPDWRGPSGERLGAVGRTRLERLAGLLRHLRSRSALPLAELVAETERTLLLDVEVAAVPGRRPGAARANLDAFADVAAAFADTGDRGDRPGLGAFLAWLAAAETEERGLDAPLGEIRPDAVQVLTVHAAKGLEWDAVAVPGLVEGTFPTGHAGHAPGRSSAWLTDLGALPYPLRGDADSLPHWRWSAARSQQELGRSFEEFRSDAGGHEVAEERRLAYVALTRARRAVLLTGALWGDGSRPRTPSRFLIEVAELAASGAGQGPDDAAVAVESWQADPEDGAVNPREHLTRAVAWPLDPLGERREALERAAAMVREAMLAGERAGGAPTGLHDHQEKPWSEPTGLHDHGGVGDPWAGEVEALLAERDAGRHPRREVELPRHLSASTMVALAHDPARLADRLRRPMPAPPDRAARQGSAFHAWLEQRFSAAALVDVDELPGAADDELDAAGDQVALEQLQQAFLASPWAERVPHAVEVTVETPVSTPAGTLMLRGRIDAVFRTPPPGDHAIQAALTSTSSGDHANRSDPGEHWEVVDWKTGAPPDGPQQARARAVQLAVYRLAWSALAGVPLDHVSAAFFYASTGETVRPVDLLDADGLAALIEQSLTDAPS